MTLHSTIRTAFEDYYESMTEAKYYWTGKDSKHTTQLIAKLTFAVKAKKESYTDEDIAGAFEYILQALKTVPEFQFYRENLSICIINSKFNEIISTIKNGKSAKKSELNRAGEIDRLLASRQGNG